MIGGFVLSGVILASSLTNVVPAQAWIQPSSTLFVNPQIRQIIETSNRNYPTIMKEHLKNANPIQISNSVTQDSPSATPSKETPKTPSSGTVTAAKKSGVSAPKTTLKSMSKSVQPAQQVKAAPSAPSKSSTQVENIISKAKSLQGIPYLWGGTTPKGFDCSGFVQYVFAQSGINLPRTAAEQYQVGTPVSRDQLTPGDLVFFSTYKPGASDVRIYIGGGLTIGSASKGIGIYSLSDSYWSKRYIGARRVSK